MKSKTILKSCLLILLLPAISNAQFKKGDWLLEGSIGNFQYSSSQLNRKIPFNNGSSNVSFGLHPSGGYFITDRIMIGATLGFGYSGLRNKTFYADNKVAYDFTYRISNLSLMPALRYYINTKKASNKFYLQVGAGTGVILATKQTSKSYDVSGNLNSTITTTYPKRYLDQYGEIILGFNHFITSNISLNMALGYDYIKSKTAKTETVVDATGSHVQYIGTQMGYNNHIFWSLGFTLIIPGKN